MGCMITRQACMDSPLGCQRRIATGQLLRGFLPTAISRIPEHLPPLGSSGAEYHRQWPPVLPRLWKHAPTGLIHWLSTGLS